MSERINIGGEILVELKRKNGKREIFRHNMMTEFGRSFALSQGINKLRYSTAKNRGTLVTLCNNAYNTISPAGVGAIPPVANPTASGGVDQTASKLCNLLMNIPSGTITKKKACFMPESANLLAYAFRDTASAANEGYIDTTGDNIPLKNRVVTRYVYPSDLAGQFNCIAMSTFTPDTTYKGRAAKVQRSIARILSAANSPLQNMLYDGTYLYLYPSDLGKVNLENGEVTDHSYTNYSDFFYLPNLTDGGSWASYFIYNGFMMQLRYEYSSSASNSYIYLSVLKADGTIQSWSTRLYGLGYRGAFFKNNSLYISFQYGSTYKVTVDSTTGAMTYATTSDDVSDLLDKAYIPLDENTYIDVNWKVNGLKINTNSIYFMHDSKLLSLALPDLYSQSWNIGYTNGSRLNSEYLLTEYGNILSFHQYDNPIVKNVGDELSVSYSYYIS